MPRRTEVTCRECGSFLHLSKEHQKKVNYDEKKITKSVVNFIKRNPATISILLALIAIGCVWGMFLTPSYAEVTSHPDPLPTLSLEGFVSFVFEIELPVMWWVMILGFLWLTKW